jgi:hypothetical protein
MAKRSARTLFELCVSRAGLVGGARLCEFVVCWAIATEDLGHDPAVTEFAAWWKEASTRTAYKRLAAFRKAFPEYDTPAPLSGPVVARVRLSRDASPAAYLNTPLAAAA